jgi:hypothetical protein
MRDLTKIEGCKAVGPRLLPIVQNVTKYSLQELKNELTRILSNPETSVSPEKAARYKESMSNIYSLPRMQMFVADIYLASAGMGITPKTRK